jgi:hypothetical protein
MVDMWEESIEAENRRHIFADSQVILVNISMGFVSGNSPTGPAFLHSFCEVYAPSGVMTKVCYVCVYHD